MNKNILTHRIVWPTGVLLAVGALGFPASAQTPPTPVPAAPAAVAVEPLRVGDATRQLLSLQRNATGPDRPIPGEQAGLSYQRYLDSFKHPIPERMGSSISSTSGNKAQ
ncbi:DUF3613 domain-containing protein [Polaromonas sp. SM01]|uniref:DUF3613 domain-containing protein n=1 Tax=Polaromonas sp. SM01 TaxID=3085630 RepID=UPI0029812FB4|nr:DUF3613 domain-containing protein [Polaromonas sp. SM01]MDW5441692.1 DUF3613 domain-containing protein [Polaromonas sp. SM01]